MDALSDVFAAVRLSGGVFLVAATGAMVLLALRIAPAGGAGPDGPDRPSSTSC